MNVERDLDKLVFIFRACILVSKKELIEEMYHEFSNGAINLVVFRITTKYFCEKSVKTILVRFQSCFLCPKCYF